MTWVRLADDFADHPKLIAAGPLAGWLWVCGLAYANKHLTDGAIPGGALRRLVDADDPSRLAARLVEVGLWERTSDGYRVHDYAEYQPSAASVRLLREKGAERQRELRSRRKSGADSGRSNGRTYTVTPATPDPAVNPVPVPDPAGNPSPLPPPRSAAEGEHDRRRRKDSADIPVAMGTAAEVRPATPGDVSLWQLALGHLPAMNDANRAEVARLEPLGRTPEGGLLLRAPPGENLDRFRSVIRRALGDAGDQAARLVSIVEMAPQA